MKNSDIDLSVAILGLGEAGSHFANDLAAMGVTVRGWDPQPKRPLHPKVIFAANNTEAVRGADIIFNVNLSAVAESVAQEIAPVLTHQQVFLEMNTASPSLKTAIYALLQPTGVRFVDLAIMAPVPPAGIRTPFLACGSGADWLFEKMQPLGLNIEVLQGKIGDAAMRKLLRSIVYKGIAAVICEAMESGQVFGMESYIRAQIHSVIGGNDVLIDRFVEGSRTHAVRRMHEMEAVVEMLQEQGVQPFLSQAAVRNLDKLSKS